MVSLKQARFSKFLFTVVLVCGTLLFSGVFFCSSPRYLVTPDHHDHHHHGHHMAAGDGDAFLVGSRPGSGHVVSEVRSRDVVFSRSLSAQFHLTDTELYFTSVNNTWCFREGVDLVKSLSVGRCECTEKYYGRDCGIPSVVWHSARGPLALTSAARRPLPRRVIHGLNVNHELDWFEVRLEELRDSVDLYIVCESNYTAGGDPRELLFLDRFNRGFMKQYHDRILYLFLDHFPPGGREDGWIADEYLRGFMTKNGLSRVSGLRQDDLFVYLDADEIPRREILLFLKLYDGWSEPVELDLQWYMYGMFWVHSNKWNKVGICTMHTLKHSFQSNAIKLRRRKASYDASTNRTALGTTFGQWTIGSSSEPAGWHFSWCYDTKGIRTKLVSAQQGDKPRWGDYEEKLELSYLARVVQGGLWFDGARPHDVTRLDPDRVRHVAPRYMVNNMVRFRHLMVHPDDLQFTVATNTT